MIEITGCETPYSRPLSPSPSLLSTSATSRASTPDPFTVTTPAFHSHLVLPKGGPAISPPMDPQTSSRTWDFVSNDTYTYLSPTAIAGESSISRRSSISSLGLDDFSTMSIFPEYTEPPQHPFESTTYSSALHYSPPTSAPLAHLTPPAQIRLPAKPEAQRLAELFFANTPAAENPLDRHSFNLCLDAVYTLPSLHAPMSFATMQLMQHVPFSWAVARFQVLIVLATALRLVGEQAAERSAGVAEGWYAVAMEGTRESRFWGEVGGWEMAALLGVFAKARRAG